MYKLDENISPKIQALLDEAKKSRISQVTSKNDVVEVMKDLIGATIEYFRVIYLDNSNRIMKITENVGTVDRSMVFPREIYKTALLKDARSIILVHNHPGGSNRASESDLEITNKIKSGCATLEIDVLDHIIISDNGIVSMREDANW